MLALIICGIVLIGFSISKMIEKIMDRRNPVEPELVANRAASPYARSASASLRNSTGKTRVLNSAPETVALNAAAPTRMLDNNGEPAGLLPDASPRTRKLANREGRSEIKVDQKMDSILPTVSLNDPIASGKADKAEEKPKEAAKKSSKKKPVDRDKGGFTLPDFKMLSKSTFTLSSKTSDQELASLGARLQSTLREFNVGASVVGWVHGPTVTLFKIALDSGVRVKAIHALSKDIALSLAAESVRIFSPIKGTSFVGIEIPNPTRDNVLLGDVLPETGGAVLTMAIGKDVEGDAITADLSKMPHLLVGGTTGSGKSVALNSMIMSILMRATPNEVRFIMVDPKRVELSLYNDIPHLYVPVVTDPNKAASALAWAVNEMERRLELLEEVGVRDIFQYNETREKEAALAAGREKLDELGVDEGVDADEIPEPLEEMPFIVIVIDELADLMMTNGKDVETSICRIAQKARAVGIHLIVATQRPSANIVTGVIKSNITSRIAFNVASGIDSRVILDTTGAENLVGHGDMLFIRPGSSEPMRIQGCYVSEEEINSVVAYLKSQSKPGYHDEIFNTKAGVGLLDGSGSAKGGSADDDLVWDAAEIVVNSGIGSTSTIQRRLSVGYARAGRIMDQLEEKGIVGPANGSKPREVLVDAEELEGIKAMWANDYL
ncbi:MAG: DNA translocase FtsK [Coriobacteriales bacterium]|nr:DNA translocase FtsK [Coriobacteriales bacterium]